MLKTTIKQTIKNSSGKAKIIGSFLGSKIQASLLKKSSWNLINNVLKKLAIPTQTKIGTRTSHRIGLLKSHVKRLCFKDRIPKKLTKPDERNIAKLIKNSLLTSKKWNNPSFHCKNHYRQYANPDADAANDSKDILE